MIRRAAEDLAPEEVSYGQFDISLVSARDPHKDVNEDCALVIDLQERGLIACVIDGMGGMSNGAEAAAITAECVSAAFAKTFTSRRAALVDGFEAANQRVATELKGAGATVVAVLLDDEYAQVIHAGDAEGFVIGQRGKLKHRTVAHSPVGYAVEAGVLDEVEALNHPERHIVSNGIGLQGMHIHIGPRVHLSKRDTVFLCSDGVTDNAFEQEIVHSLRKGPLKKASHRLFNLCHKRVLAAFQGEFQDGEPAKSDDLTFAVIRRR